MKHYKKQSSFRNSLRMKLCFFIYSAGCGILETNEKLDGGIVKLGSAIPSIRKESVCRRSVKKN